METLRELWYECTYRLWYKITTAKDEVKYAWQRAIRGYDVTAYWGLCDYITDIILPVLKGYRTGGRCSIPSLVCRKNESLEKSSKRWDGILDKMIVAFELIKKDDFILQPEDERAIQEGLNLFAKYFRSLWD